MSLLNHYTDADYVMSIVMELSETNYIYIPLLRARTDEEAQQLYKNIMNGDKKKQYYGELLNYFYETRKRILSELFKYDLDNQISDENADSW